MRALMLLLLLAIGCGKSKSSSEEASGSAAVAAALGPQASSLALDHITLLEPDSVLSSRLSDVDALTAVIKQATDTVAAYDAKHAGSLPDDLDLVIAARANATHAWVVGAKGDIVVPELDTALAKLPAVPVKEGVVGAVATLAHAGTHPAQRGPYLPASWKAAAGAGGASIDDVIEKAWPR